MSGYAYAAKEPTASTSDNPDGWPDDWTLNWVDAETAAIADQLQAAVENAQYLLNYFDTLDTNGDGALTLAESGLTADEFNMLDLDGDGYLTEAELQSITDGLTFEEAQLMIPDITQDQFNDIDLNGDGELSYDELVAAEADPSLDDWIDAWDNIVGDDPPWPPGWPVVDPDNPDDPYPDPGDNPNYPDPPDVPLFHTWTVDLTSPAVIGEAQRATVYFKELESGAPSTAWKNHTIRLVGVSHKVMKNASDDGADSITFKAPNASSKILTFYAEIPPSDDGDDLTIGIEIPTIYSGMQVQDSATIDAALTVTVEFGESAPDVNESFSMTITVKNSQGNVVANYDGTDMTLTVDARVSGGSWGAFTYLVMANGSPIDLSKGWSNGVWSADVKYTDADGKDECRVTSVVDGVDNGSGTFDLGTEAALGKAILERQKAVGIAQVDWIDLTATYTLAQYKTFVNDCCTTYISGTYTTGASVPTLLPADYADSATTIAELLTLVKAMLTTYHSSPTQGNPEYREGTDDESMSAHGNDFDATYAAALSNAQATFNGSVVNGWHDITRGACLWDDDYDQVRVNIQAARCTFTLSGLSTLNEGSVRFFVKTTKDSTYNWPFVVSSSDITHVYSDLGRTGIPAENQYGSFDTQAKATAVSSVTSDYFGDLSVPPVTKTGGSGPDAGNNANYELADEFALVDWSFEIT